MTDTANGGLPEAAAKPVGQDFDDMLKNSGPEAIVALIAGDDEPARPEGDEKGDSEAVEASKTVSRAWGFDVAEINRSYAVVVWGGQTVVINEQATGPVNDRVRVMTFESMNQWFANTVTEVEGSDGKRRPVTWAKAWQSHPDRRQYDGFEFFPNPDGAKSTPNYLNLWRGFSFIPSPAGTCNRFKDHLRVNVCQENEEHYRYILGWMAHLVQRPRERPGIALVLRGRKGTGKTVVGDILGSLFAPHYFIVDDARYLTGQFNAHMTSCLLLQVDEGIWAGDKAAEGRFKGLLTSRTQMIEAKRVDPIRMENRVRVIVTSNEEWVVPATGDERRFFVLDVGEHAARNNQYFAEMYEELDNGGREKLLHELLTFDLSQFDISRIPQTRALLDQKLRSLDPIDDFVFNRLWAGSLLHGDDSWRVAVPRDDLYGEYLKDAARMGIGRKRSSADFGKRLKKLIPGIGDARPSLEREPGVAKRTWCYSMPSLDECRAAFDKHVGQQVDWPALPPGEGERAQHSPDDIVPV